MCTKLSSLNDNIKVVEKRLIIVHIGKYIEQSLAYALTILVVSDLGARHTCVHFYVDPFCQHRTEYKEEQSPC